LSGLNKFDHSLSTIEIETIVKNLGFDPFLIGLYVENFISNQDIEKCNSINIISTYIEMCIQELEDYFANYNDLIIELTSYLIADNNYNVSLRKIRDWFNDRDKLNALKNLIEQGKICKVNDSLIFSFRHDRLKDYFITQNLIRLMQHDLSNRIFYDPFYAPLLAHAIDFINLPIETIKEYMLTSPTIPFEYLKVNTDHNNGFRKIITEMIIEWINSNDIKENINDPFIWEVFHSVGWLLKDIDSPDVLEITENLPHYNNIALARLRNGSIDSGIRYCSQYGRRILRTNDSFLFKISEHAFKNHKDLIINDIKNILSNPSSKDVNYIKGTLFLIGHLRIIEVEEELAEFWQLAQQKSEILSLMLWAVFRIYTSSFETIMDHLISYWLTLPEKGDNSISKVAQDLEFAIQENINPEVFIKLIKATKNYKKLDWPIKHLLKGVDSPIAVEFTVKTAAEVKKSLEGTGKISIWLDDVYDKWNPYHFRSRKMSNESVNHLKTIWENGTNNDLVRKIAFDLWLFSLKQDDLSNLVELRDNALFNDKLLYRKVQLGDFLSIFDYCKILESKPYWVSIAHNIWSKTVADKIVELIVEEEFISDQKNYDKESFFWDLAEVLTKISENEADNFISNNWDILKSNNKIIQASLYVGTERCLGLTEKYLVDIQGRENIFEFIASLFGCQVYGKSEYLTLDKIKNITPYLNDIRPNEIGYFGQHCQKLGAVEWSKEYLYKRMDPLYKKILHPTDDQLYSEIIEILRRDRIDGYVYRWVEEFDERKDPKERMIGLLVKLLDNVQTYKAVKFVSLSLIINGSRNDINILERTFPHEISLKVDKLREAVKFRVYRRTLN